MATQGKQSTQNDWPSGGRGPGPGRNGAVGSMQGYGQPTNQGPGMFGRGRMPGRGGRGGMMPGGRGGMMPGGRGGMMPGGRGGMMPGGRGGMMPGGRGGMMPGGRGRGQGGRMMMPSQGRGRGGRTMTPGRGGRGRGQKQSIPSKLDVFNRYVGFKISSFCDRDDQERLGFSFPQFTPSPLSPEQQKMRMMKKMSENKNELRNPYGINDSDCNNKVVTADGKIDAGLQEDTGILEPSNKATDTCDSGLEVAGNGGEDSKNDSIASKKEEAPLENESAGQPKGTSEDANNAKNDDEKGIKNDVNPEQAIETEIDPEKKKEMMKQREENMRINMTDCHTLLAQLNTKRLYRRIKYFKRNDPNYNVDKAYPYNMDTDKISTFEWEALIDDYKGRRIEIQKQQEMKDIEKAEKKARERMNRSKKKKKKGKGKGRGNKSEKAKRHESAEKEGEEEEAETGKESEGDLNVAEVNDLEKGKNSDVDVTESISESDDESIEDTDFEYVGDKPSKYEMLMFTPCPRAVAVLASYPRSGNSLMRNLYEKITLRVTGSDMMGGLQKHDLVGEMATGTNNVQFVKTHYPERMGNPPFLVSRAVLLVRNPYDAMDSYFNLMSTNTHTTSLTAEARKKFSKLFADMARKEVLVWRDFHEYWLKQKIPLMVVRYEDLIRDTVRVVSKVIKFVLEVSSMTFFEDRIQRAIGEEQVEKLGPYKARSGGIGKSLTKGNYTPQLLNQINYGIVGTMEKFGYKEMLIPNPSSWKLKPLDKWGVFIPGKSKEPMMINQKGLVRGPNRQTNWRMVKQMMDNEKKEENEKASTPKKVNLL